MIRRHTTWTTAGLALLALASAACTDTGAGRPLPRNSFQFPTGIAVHPMGFALVVSSNFDLTYESGSLRIIDLNLLAETLSIDADHRDTIIDDYALSIGDFGSSAAIAPTDDGGLAAVLIRADDRLVIIDLDIETAGGRATLALQCSPGQSAPDPGGFNKCDGSRHLLPLAYDDPFGLLLFDGTGEDAEGGTTALVGYLRSGMISALQIPDDRNDVPRVAYELETESFGTYDLARSDTNGYVYVTSRITETRTNPIYYFDSAFGQDAVVYRENMFTTFLGYETRSVTFTADGTTAALLVRSPDMLVFLDTSIGSDGLPRNDYLGHVVLGSKTSRVRAHGDQLFVTAAEDDTVFVVDAAQQRLIALREDVCRGPFDIAFFDRGDDHWALITCFEDDTVAVMDVDPDSSTYLEILGRVGQPRNKKD